MKMISSFGPVFISDIQQYNKVFNIDVYSLTLVIHLVRRIFLWIS